MVSERSARLSATSRMYKEKDELCHELQEVQSGFPEEESEMRGADLMDTGE